MSAGANGCHDASRMLELCFAAVEATEDMVIISDRHGRITYVNPAFSRHTGYGRDEAVGQSTSLLKSGRHDRTFYHRLWSTVLAGQVWQGMMINRTKDGREYPEEMTITPIVGKAGTVEYFVAIKRDITQRRQAEAERDQLLHDKAERIKELQCVHDVLQVMHNGLSIDESLRQAAALITPGWQFPDITRVRIRLDGREYVSQPFAPTPWRLAAQIMVDGVVRGSVEVYYLEPRPEADEGPFLKEESSLLNDIAVLIAGTLARRENEASAHAQEMKYQEVASNLPGIVYQVKMNCHGELRMPFVSDKCTQIVGWTPEDLSRPGFDPITLVHEEDTPRLRMLIAKHSQALTPLTDEVRVWTKDNQIKWLRICGTPRPDQNHNILWDGVILDVTEQKQMQIALALSEQRYRSMVQHMPGVTYECKVGGDWALHFVSGQIEDLLGYPASKFTSAQPLQYIDFILPEDRSEILNEIQQKISAGQTFCVEYRIRHRDGSIHWVQDTGCGVKSEMDQTINLLGMTFDVTASKLAEESRRQQEQLEQAIEAMSGVLGIVGHELRTPLAALRATSEYLLDSSAVDLDDTHSMLQAIHDETIRMAEMVNNLLEAARLNSGVARWSWSTVYLSDITQVACDTVQRLIDPTRIDLTFDVDPPDLAMRGDCEAVRRLLVNLLTNAAKHTTDGYICVRIWPQVSEEGALVKIEIADSGQGIAPDMLDSLGRAFVLNAGSIGAGIASGTGLGLSICRGIAYAHGGEISVASAPGQGTTFTVTLRADLEEPRTQGDAPPILREHAG